MATTTQPAASSDGKTTPNPTPGGDRPVSSQPNPTQSGSSSRGRRSAASVGSALASATQAKRFVLVGVGGTAVLATIGTYRAGRTPSPRIAVGAVTAGVILAVLAEVLPDLAGALALLMLTTAAFVTLQGGWEGISAATQIGT